jgi:hypothetical protein
VVKDLILSMAECLAKMETIIQLDNNGLRALAIIIDKALPIPAKPAHIHVDFALAGLAGNIEV